MTIINIFEEDKYLQEPGNEEDIKRFVKETFNFEPDLYAKINVNGAEEHPLYTFLKNQKRGILTDAIKWNFTKFLISRHGKVVSRILLKLVYL